MSSPDTYGLSVRDTMTEMQNWLIKKEPFLHIRYNDGEWNAMFHLRSPKQTTSEEHHYTKNVCDALFNTFEELADEIVLKDSSHILVGATWQIEYNLESSQVFDRYVKSKPGLLGKMRWCAGDVWYTTADEVNQTVDSKGTIELIDELRTGGHRVVLVCNQTVKKAAHCLGAVETILIPQQDAFCEYQQTLWKCQDEADQPTVFVWCAGFLAKPISWQIHKEFPQCSHIDLGHLFDGVFNLNNRGWLQRAESEAPHWSHWRYLQNTFKPYVLGFIP